MPVFLKNALDFNLTSIFIFSLLPFHRIQYLTLDASRSIRNAYFAEAYTMVPAGCELTHHINHWAHIIHTKFKNKNNNKMCFIVAIAKYSCTQISTLVS